MTDRYTLNEFETATAIYSSMAKAIAILRYLEVNSSIKTQEKREIRECLETLTGIADRLADNKNCLRLELQSKLDERMPEVTE